MACGAIRLVSRELPADGLAVGGVAGVACWVATMIAGIVRTTVVKGDLCPCIDGVAIFARQIGDEMIT